MKNSKRTGKSSGKKSLTPKKQTQNSLTAILIAKHTNVKEIPDRISLTALLLQTILSGSDDQLRQILQQWSDEQSIRQIVAGWGSSNTVLFFHRIATILNEQQCKWTYSWIRQILNSKVKLDQKDIQKISSHIENKKQQNLNQVLKLQGKLDMIST